MRSRLAQLALAVVPAVLTLNMRMNERRATPGWDEIRLSPSNVPALCKAARLAIAKTIMDVSR